MVAVKSNMSPCPHDTPVPENDGGRMLPVAQNTELRKYRLLRGRGANRIGDLRGIGADELFVLPFDHDTDQRLGTRRT